MIPGDQRDQQQIAFAQPEYLAVANQVHRVLVHRAIADIGPDFVQQGRDVQQHFVTRIKLVFVLQLFE